MFEKKWNISPEEIEDKEVSDKYRIMQKDADSKMRQRTKGFELYTRISHMQNIYDHTAKDSFSEGSTQAIKRKIRSETIQRVPDGEIKTQFDKNSIEQVQIEYIFKNKVLHSEYDGKDMLKNLTRAFNASYDYGYACVRTGFEKDLDGDVRISFKHIQWADVLPAPDCDFIEEAEWYMIREYVSRTQLKELIDCDTGELKPEHSSYEEKTVKYLLENEYVDAGENRSRKMADTKKAVFKTESVETWTLYWRGMDEFVTFVPSVNAVLRRTKNYDPRGDLPLHFLILEPDPEFPLGVSSVMYTLGQQQYADAFQTVSYQTLLLAAQPPLMGLVILLLQRLR